VLLALAAAAIVLALTPVLSPPTYQKLVLHFVEQIGISGPATMASSTSRAEHDRRIALTGLGFDGFANIAWTRHTSTARPGSAWPTATSLPASAQHPSA